MRVVNRQAEFPLKFDYYLNEEIIIDCEKNMATKSAVGHIRRSTVINLLIFCLITNQINSGTRDVTSKKIKRQAW